MSTFRQVFEAHMFAWFILELPNDITTYEVYEKVCITDNPIYRTSTWTYKEFLIRNNIRDNIKNKPFGVYTKFGKIDWLLPESR